jgi:hypothetical protein
MSFVLFNKTWYCTAIDPWPLDNQIVTLCISGKITSARFDGTLMCFVIENRAIQKQLDPKKMLLYWAEFFD